MAKESPFQPAEEKNTVPNDHVGRSALLALVVGIGAAEGAMKSLGTILAGIPSGRGVAVILVHHPELAGKNLLKLLKQQAALEVVEATNGMTVLADRIHVMPPDRFLNITAGRLTHSEPVHCNGLLMPIDHFFCSLADDRRNRCCGILLSGKGGDGTLGLSEIRAGGGRTIVEDPKSARFPAMQQGAMDAGAVDAVLPAGAIAEAVAELAGQVAARNSSEAPAEPEAGLRAILDILHARVGHDFRCYKPNTITRRIRRRMTQGRIATLDDYARHLADHPDETDLLQKDLLIGVTDFFRQPQAWETLERKVIAPLIENAVPGSVIRVWIPGCSSGKEVYSLAMLMAEQANVISGKIDFQIFATDADYTALTAARTGCYTMDEIGSTVSPERLKRFFSRRDSRYQVIKTLRGRVIFAAQNITADPPFSRLDLVVCRNLLIYLDQPMQKKIIALFHFALREEGFLFLGNAETIGDREDLFEPILKKWRIYRRIGVGRRMNADVPVHPSGAPCAAAVKSPTALMPGQSLTSTAQQVLLERFAPACVMIDRRLQVLYTHGAIENYLKFPAGELTTRVTDMAREGLRARLRGMIGKCIESGRTVSFTARTRRGEKSVPVKAAVIPLRHPRGSNGLLLITFEDQRLPAAKCGAQTADHGDVLQLADELKITREELQSTIDQLEGSNDQLKASNEEVMAANEELQASNEEMETSKEELQSLNEELNTINLRLQEKVDELESVNNDVVNLLASTSIATVFLDKAFRIKRYTPAITQLMSLIPSDRGRPLGDILMRFTDEALLDEARRVLVDLTPRAKEVRADDGRWHIRRVTPYRTQDDRIEGVVITFVDVTDLKQAEEGVRESRRRLALIVDSIADGFFALDRQWRFTHINDEALAHFRKTSEEVIGRTLFEVFPAIRGTAFETRYRNAMESGEPAHFEVPSTVADMVMEIHAYPGRENLTVLFRNVTERHRMVQALREAHERVAWLARFPEENPNPVVRASADGNVLYANPAAARRSVWACAAGAPLPGPLRLLVVRAMARGEEIQQDIQWDDRIFGVSVTPFPVESYANIYGRDITQRTLAEAALRESELKAATLLNAAGESIWLFGPDGDVLAANTTAARRIGKTVREVVGTKWADFMDDNLRKSRGERIAEVIRTGEPLHFEDERAGIVFDHAFYPARDGAGNIMGVAAFSRDITERKRTEEVLHRYELLAEHGRDIILLARRDDGRILEANAAALSQYGYSRDQLLSLSIRDLRAEGTREITADQMAEADARGILFETVHKLRDGGTFPVEVSSRGATICGVRILVSIIRDITKRKRVEEALRQLNAELEERVIELDRSVSERDALTASLATSEERLKLFIEHAPAALAMFDCRMCYMGVSRRWRSEYGLGDAELIGVSHYDALPEISEEWREAHRRGLTGEVLRAKADRFVRADGSVHWVHWEVRPWYDAAGTIGGIVIFSEDITELMQVTETLENRSEQLAAANRELESFSYSVSHDLQAPLRAIDGYSRMILRKHAECFNEDALAKFNIIRSSTQMMGQLINDLLAFSRLGKAHLSIARLEMDVLIREVWEEIRAANPERRLTLTIREIPPAMGDRALIRQVLVNILSNSVKFTRERPEALIEASGYVSGAECIYAVQDNGVGFDMQYHDKMFGVFQRLHSNEEFEGTGVGLAIVQRIIHRHDGRVWAEGEVGKGVCLYFSLPCGRVTG